MSGFNSFKHMMVIKERNEAASRTLEQKARRSIPKTRTWQYLEFGFRVNGEYEEQKFKKKGQ